MGTNNQAETSPNGLVLDESPKLELYHCVLGAHHNEPRLNAVFRFKELNYGYTLVNKYLMIFFSLKN